MNVVRNPIRRSPKSSRPWEEFKNAEGRLALKNVHAFHSIAHRLLRSRHLQTCNPTISLPDSLSLPLEGLIPISARPISTLFRPLPRAPYSLPLCLLSHAHTPTRTHTHKSLITTWLNLYGNSKPLILREGEMLSAIEPQNCSTSKRDS